MLLAKLRKYEDAIPVWARVIELKPDDPTVRVSLGWALGQSGRFRGALHAYEKVLELMPDFVGAYYNIGLFHWHLHEYRESIEFERKALAIDPATAEARCVLGLSLAAEGHRDAALEECEQALKRRRYRRGSGLYRTPLQR